MICWGGGGGGGGGGLSVLSCNLLENTLIGGTSTCVIVWRGAMVGRGVV